MTYFSGKNCIKIKHVFLKKKCRFWHIVGKAPKRPLFTIWSMRISCGITNDTNTHTKWVTHFFSTCSNAVQCYVTRTLPVLLYSLIFWIKYYQNIYTLLTFSNVHICTWRWCLLGQMNSTDSEICVIYWSAWMLLISARNSIYFALHWKI